MFHTRSSRRFSNRSAEWHGRKCRLDTLESRRLLAVTSGLPSGLVAAYSFDEGAGSLVADVSGNGNAGTTSNTTWSTAGRYGNALSFNGTNALVTIADSTALHLSAGMTLEAW